MEDVMLAYLFTKYPWIVKVFMVIGMLRLIFKPIMFAISNYVKNTPEISDDEKLKKIMESKWYFVLCFFFDLTMSIKLPRRNKD